MPLAVKTLIWLLIQAARSRPVRNALLIAILIVVGGMVVIFAVVIDFFTPDWPFHSRTGTAAGVPAIYLPIYQEAERVFHVHWALLASIHAQETNFNESPNTFKVNGSGCAGPMQIGLSLKCGCTWCDHDVKNAYLKGNRPDVYARTDDDQAATPDHPSIYDTFDAVMAAAVVLRHKVHGKEIPNLDGTARRAACGYYGACADLNADYADDVMARAKRFDAGYRPDGEGTGQLGWPVPQDTPVTSPFCERRDYEDCHPGVDLGVGQGAPVYAAGDGRVSTARWTGGYGNYICIDHTPVLRSCYAHLSAYAVHAGAEVTRGQEIGKAGSTGHSTGPHLHFEVRENGRVTCPALYVEAPEEQWCDPQWRAGEA
ncbi:MAG: hypothetical protein V7607_5467 [Solirubrobacteraceae bacterium]